MIYPHDQAPVGVAFVIRLFNGDEGAAGKNIVRLGGQTQVVHTQTFHVAELVFLRHSESAFA